MATDLIRLKEFSNYRSELMGVAIIMIMASHTLGGFATYGIIGVEWFLILSAIGQWYSLEKDYNVIRYYKRRLIRIVPAYLIVSIPIFIIRFPSIRIQVFFLKLSGLNFFINGDKSFWFVYLIIVCYLITPFYFLFVKSHRYSYITPFVLVLITFIASFFFPKTEILYTRIPVFLLGMNLARNVYEEKIISDRRTVKICQVGSLIAVLLLLIIYLDIVRIEVVRLVYFLCGIPSLLFVLSFLKRFPFFNRFLSFMGMLSYELYLIHQPVALYYCRRLPLPEAFKIILSYIVALILAYILHSIIGLFRNMLQNSSQHSI